LELALRELEWIGVMAAGLADHAYPVGDLELIWKEILLFQFHDILPGTSITRVFEESTARYEALTDEVERLTSSASQRLSAIVDLSSASDPALVFNSLPWPRSEWMSVKGSWHLVRDAPAMGYAVVDLASESGNSQRSGCPRAGARERQASGRVC
jgi:alpha-mannosidase